jgi:hypothetical protein
MIEPSVESLARLTVYFRVGAVEAECAHAFQVGPGKEEVGMFQSLRNDTVDVGDVHGNSWRPIAAGETRIAANLRPGKWVLRGFVC